MASYSFVPRSTVRTYYIRQDLKTVIGLVQIINGEIQGLFVDQPPDEDLVEALELWATMNTYTIRRTSEGTIDIIGSFTPKRNAETYD
jgi:hypothetical protein